MSDIKLKIYNHLVNRNSGIRHAYHKLHDNADGKGKLKSYAALLGMNAQYYLMGKRDFNTPADVKAYEEKELAHLSESVHHIKKYGLSVDGFVKKLSSFDVISFDVFDTLLLRPFSHPTDIFFTMEEKLGIMDFKRIRVEQEYLAREKHRKTRGDNEVTFAEIYDHIEVNVGLAADRGMALELETERQFCFADPFMMQVFEALKEQGKTIIAVSDMYLPSGFVRELLEEKGFAGIDNIYMSCEYGKSKSDGSLYEVVKKDIISGRIPADPDSYKGEKASDAVTGKGQAETTSYQARQGNKELTLVHVGDNEHSDVKMAETAGITAYLYPNVNVTGSSTRAYDMSPFAGSAYRGVVNSRIFSGLKKYAPEYEYGYIYGGILVLGYCSFIHNYCKKNGIDRILFLSRDGEIVKRAYDHLYPGEDTVYAYISRSVVTRLMRNKNRYDYFLRFIDKKINQGIRISDILKSMGADPGKEPFILASGKTKGSSLCPLSPDDVLTDKNKDVLKKYLINNFEKINEAHREFDEAAKFYYTDILSGSKKAAVVDIGWAGSAAVSLMELVNEWGADCEITGLLAGTNSIHNSEPEAAESWLQRGKLVPYVFSQALNRDIMKKHDPAKFYNVYWELLFSSPTPQFTGFEKADADPSPDLSKQENPETEAARSLGKLCFAESSKRTNNIRLCFGAKDSNEKGTKRIQKGIMDFIKDYHSHFKDHPYMMNISGRDAAAPMLLASGHDERYLKVITKRFDFKIDVN